VVTSPCKIRPRRRWTASSQIRGQLLVVRDASHDCGLRLYSSSTIETGDNLGAMTWTCGPICSYASWCVENYYHMQASALSTISAAAVVYIIQSIDTSALTMSVFALLVSTTIQDLTISEFISCMRKHTNFIRLQILKQYIKLENRNYKINLKRKLHDG
jgi:hypothetical protein